MHGQQHVADLLDLTGEKGQHYTDGKEHRRQQKVFQGTVLMFHRRLLVECLKCMDQLHTPAIRLQTGFTDYFSRVR